MIRTYPNRPTGIIFLGLGQQLVARPWQEKLGFNVSKDRAAASRAVIYMLAGCKNVAGTAEIIEGQVG